MSGSWTRRQFVSTTAVVLGGLGLVSTAGADDERRSFVAEQAGACYPVEPLDGDEPVEAFYDWGKEVRSWSSEGTRDLQRSESSQLFLYRGPEGLSLVVLHDRADDETPGGAASFTIRGVPDGATWAVKDDLYDAPTNVDTWEINGTVLDANETADGDIEAVPEMPAPVDDSGNATAVSGRTDEIDWWWTTGRTDGGALRGLGVDDLGLEVAAAFNEDAALFEDPDHGEITTWTLLSGEIDDPDRTELDPDAPLTLRTGTCGDSEPTAGADKTPDVDTE